MSKSYDLSTSTKWANLADGEHVVKLKSKGAGYGTSSFSNEVTVKKGAAGETWVLNETLGTDELFGMKDSYFTSNAISFRYLTRRYEPTEYRDRLTYFHPSEDAEVVYYGQVEKGTGFVNSNYRTIVFDEPVTDSTLLTWLQANGTKQGGGVTEHTLTSKTIASHNIKVNGSALSALPYTLRNGDTIVVTLTGMEDSAISLNGVTRSNDDVVTVKDTDIAVELVDGSYNDPKLTINYTA